jgi:hypothetical protein
MVGCLLYYHNDDDDYDDDRSVHILHREKKAREK